MQIQLFSSNITCTRNQTSLSNTSTSNIFQQWCLLRVKLRRMVLLSHLPNPLNPHHPAYSLPPPPPSAPLLPGWLPWPQVYSLRAMFALAFAGRGEHLQTAALGIRLCAALRWCLSHQYFQDSLDILQEWGGSTNPTVTSVT